MWKRKKRVKSAYGLTDIILINNCLVDRLSADLTRFEMFKVHSQVQEEMARKVEDEVKDIKNKTSFKFLVYDKSRGIISENTSSLS